MKKILTDILLLIFLFVTLSACAPISHPDIFLFTDRLSKICGDSEIKADGMEVTGNIYRLLLKENQSEVLLTAEKNEKNEIKKVRLSIIKTDNKGKTKAPSQEQTDFYIKKVAEVLEAFTFFEKDRCEDIIKKILPLKGEDLLKTGELTTEADNFHLIYYSNAICCQFTVVNTFLEKTETTEKPVSKPLFDVTAKASAED